MQGTGLETRLQNLDFGLLFCAGLRSGSNLNQSQNRGFGETCGQFSKLWAATSHFRASQDGFREAWKLFSTQAQKQDCLFSEPESQDFVWRVVPEFAEPKKLTSRIWFYPFAVLLTTRQLRKTLYTLERLLKANADAGAACCLKTWPQHG